MPTTTPVYNLKVKSQMTDRERADSEFKLTKEFMDAKDDTKADLTARVSGVSAKAGGSGYQFVGYTKLEQFYRGDQWDHNEPAGASQRTDNYCAVIIDNLSSIPFDDPPEVDCPVDDPTDEIQEIKAELKEKLLMRVWDENKFEVEFDCWSKGTSLYGDGFIVGPWIEKRNEYGELMSMDAPGGKKKIVFRHVENPGSIRLVYEDNSYAVISGFIETCRYSKSKAMAIYGAQAQSRGITLAPSTTSTISSIFGQLGESQIPMVDIEKYWTSRRMCVFVQDKMLDWYTHNWGFVPIVYAKANYTPNHPYGKSDIEDVLDPQLAHNVTNNDLANLLKWVSTVNFWGKNLEGMQALVAGLSRIYSLPEDGELHTFEKPGDPYVTNTYVAQRRAAIVEISGVSESLLSTSQLSNASGRALALAFQGTIRKLNPRVKRFRAGLEELNANILKLAEIYFPETKVFIDGDYRNKVYLPVTLLRNIVDTINKFQSGLISQETAMREVGVNLPAQERRIMKRDLQDPILAPQVARQPSLLPQLQEGQNDGSANPNPAPGNAPAASQAGAVARGNNNASGGAPTPQQ